VNAPGDGSHKGETGLPGPAAHSGWSRPGAVPSETRLRRGPVALVLCDERLPCDPCVEACPNGCITLTEPVVGEPVLDAEACDGCGACITSCPAGAIIVVDLTAGRKLGRVWLPYEMLPLPAAGETVRVLDPVGQDVGEGKAVSVRPPEEGDGTAVICVEVPKEFALCAAALRPERPR